MENKKIILGLDLGTTSIGWAVVNELHNKKTEIIGLGSRIIPLMTDEKKEFQAGNAISKKNSETNTAKRI